jgi:hypothetical protein
MSVFDNNSGNQVWTKPPSGTPIPDYYGFMADEDGNTHANKVSIDFWTKARARDQALRSTAASGERNEAVSSGQVDPSGTNQTRVAPRNENQPPSIGYEQKGALEFARIQQEMSLNLKQTYAFFLIVKSCMRRRNETSAYEARRMLVTGVAGTGKSRFIKSLSCWYDAMGHGRNYVIAAPTGMAAINVGGTTIHSCFGLECRPIEKDLWQSKLKKAHETNNAELKLR